MPTRATVGSHYVGASDCWEVAMSVVASPVVQGEGENRLRVRTGSGGGPQSEGCRCGVSQSWEGGDGESEEGRCAAYIRCGLVLADLDGRTRYSHPMRGGGNGAAVCRAWHIAQSIHTEALAVVLPDAEGRCESVLNLGDYENGGASVQKRVGRGSRGSGRRPPACTRRDLAESLVTPLE